MTAENGVVSRRARGDVSLVMLVNVLLRRRRIVLICAVVGAALGVATRILRPRPYQSMATFLTQGSDNSSGKSGLLAAATQLGLVGSQQSASWGPFLYDAVIDSRAFLERVAFDSVTVAEMHGARMQVADLLGVPKGSPEARGSSATRAMRGIIDKEVNPQLNEITLTVTTPWPSVSYQIAQLLLAGVNRFNLETRQSQARAERQFTQVQANEALAALNAAEDRLMEFMTRNRNITGSPELLVEQQRLQLDVNLRQQLYTTLLQNAENAKLAEVRDTPVITVMDPPRVPAQSSSRLIGVFAILGIVGGGLLGVFIAFFVHGLSRLGTGDTDDEREFAMLLREATPRVLKARWSQSGTTSKTLS